MRVRTFDRHLRSQVPVPGHAFIGAAWPKPTEGGAGNDRLFGLDGDDVLNGTSGNDTGDGGKQVTADVCISIEIDELRVVPP